MVGLLLLAKVKQKEADAEIDITVPEGTHIMLYSGLVQVLLDQNSSLQDAFAHNVTGDDMF